MAFDSHLPEGIEPGPQTLRLQAEGAGMRGVLPALTVLFIACFIGIPLGVVSVTDSQGVIYATLGVLAVVFVVGMWVVARRFRPQASESAAPFELLAVDQLDVRRGEELEAELTIYDPGELEERIEVGLVCVERYDRPESRRSDDGVVVEERGIDEDVAYERWISAWRTEELQTVTFHVPQEAPYSYEGECLSFAWRVSAREVGRSDEDGVVDDPIWVLP
jgi:hypothetical protein